MKLHEIAKHIYLKDPPQNLPDIEISGVAAIDHAREGELTFIYRDEYEKFASSTRASCLIANKNIPDVKNSFVLTHPNPYWAFAKAASLFSKAAHRFHGISPKAFIHPSAKLGEDITVGAFAYIDADVSLGNNSVIFPNVFIGHNSEIGCNVEIRANTTIEYATKIGDRVIIHANCSIGSDGFGFAPSGNKEIAPQKIPQTGIVRIESDVEVGSSCTIDRAALGETLIRRGTKLDSNIHIAHNVEIGEHCMFAAMTGIAGSTKIGDRVLIGGHAGINGHIEIGNDITIGAKAGVTKSLLEKGMYMGFPAIPASEWRRQMVYQRKISVLEEKIKALEEKIKNN